MKGLFYLPFLLLLLVGCRSEQENMIQDYLVQFHGDEGIQLVSAKNTTQVTAADSFEIVNAIFEAGRDSALLQLDSALVLQQDAFEIARRGYEGSQFPALKPLFKETMDQSASKLEEVKAAIQALNSDCKETTLEGIYNKVKAYEAMGERVLLQHYDCVYFSGESSNQVKQVVFLSPEHTMVRGLLKGE